LNSVSDTDVFLLESNAFFSLGASPNSTSDEINELAEDAEFDGNIPEDIVQRAKNALLVPNLRLDEELSYLLGQSEQQVQKVITDLKSGTLSLQASAYKHYSDISRLNILAHSFSRNMNQAEILEYMNLWRGIDEEETINLINDSRHKSGMPKVSDEQFNIALGSLRARHSAAFNSGLWKTEKPGAVMEVIVEDELKVSSPSKFLDVLIRDFDERSEPSLVLIEKSIDQEIEAAERVDTKLWGAIYKISDLLVDWDDVNQAVQLYEQSKGLEEGRSKRIYQKIRSLSLLLANDNGKIEEAKYLSEASLRTFPELEVVASELKADLNVLNELAMDKRLGSIIQPLMDASAAAKLKPALLAKQILSAGITGVSRRKPLKILKSEFEAVVGNPDTALFGFQVLRDVALFLHNDHNQTAASLRLITDLLDYSGKPTGQKATEFFSLLTNDHYQLKIQIYRKNIAAQNDNLAGVEMEMRKLVAFAKGSDLEDAKAGLALIIAERERRKKALLIKIACWVGGLTFLAIVMS